MAKKVDPANLIDAHEVARIVGLGRPTSVAVYRNRYAGFPEPVVNLGRGRPMLWLRADIEAWARLTGRLR